MTLLAPAGDEDGDGMRNDAEAVAGTDPFDADSLLRILNFGNGNQLTWTSVSNQAYRIEATADLAMPFQPLSGIVTATGPVSVYSDLAATNAIKFYRVKVAP